jgi:DNA-binding transcriptional LysR family regulator
MLDAMTLDQMRTFAAAAEAGSFRAAAGRLNRAQSAVSHAISNLEAQLGLALFDRTGHRPTLTNEGRILLSDVRAILLKVDAMRARARGLGSGVELDFSVVVDTLFPTAVVGAGLMALREAFPSVALRLESKPLGGPLAALRERTCTVAIVAGEDFRDPSVAYHSLEALRIVAVIAAGHPLASQAQGHGPVAAIDLADHLQIVLEDPTPISEGRDFHVLSPGTCRVNTQEAKRELIVAGLGWGRLPLWAVKRDLADGGLVRLPVAGLGQDGEASTQAYLAHRVDQPLGPAARAFQAAMVREFAGDHLHSHLSALAAVGAPRGTLVE